MIDHIRKASTNWKMCTILNFPKYQQSNVINSLEFICKTKQISQNKPFYIVRNKTDLHASVYTVGLREMYEYWIVLIEIVKFMRRMYKFGLYKRFRMLALGSLTNHSHAGPAHTVPAYAPTSLFTGFIMGRSHWWSHSCVEGWKFQLLLDLLCSLIWLMVDVGGFYEKSYSRENGKESGQDKESIGP